MTREFYRWFRDDYDFLKLVYLPSRPLNRFHASVKNEVLGIGLSQFNFTAAHGSAGRLQGVSHFPIPMIIDGAEQGYLHELGHQWIDFLSFAPFAQGRPHWPYSSMGTGIMGISIGGPVPQGGNFACDIQEQDNQILLKPRAGPPGFNDLDLYLMGFLRAEDVRTQFVFDDQQAAQKLGCVGQVYGGAMTRVTAQDVVQQLGARQPAVAQAQVQFRIGTVPITRDGPASPETMWLYSALAERAEARSVLPMRAGLVRTQGQPFALATRGLGSLDTRLIPKDALSIEGLAYGPLSARKLNIKLRPEPQDIGARRQVFVAALVGGTQWYFRSAAGWTAWSSGPMPIYADLSLPSELGFAVLDGTLDLSGLVGTQIIVGYGQDAADMLDKGRYARVHIL